MHAHDSFNPRWNSSGRIVDRGAGRSLRFTKRIDRWRGRSNRLQPIQFDHQISLHFAGVGGVPIMLATIITCGFSFTLTPETRSRWHLAPATRSTRRLALQI